MTDEARAELALVAYRGAWRAVDAAGDRIVAWGSMVYACQGRRGPMAIDPTLEPCGHEERYYLGVGVEGPRALRESVDAAVLLAGPDPSADDVRRLLDELADGMSYLASPVAAGRCLACGGGRMAHVRFAEDEEHEPWVTPPDGARLFRVPDPPAAAYMAIDQGLLGAELVRVPGDVRGRGRAMMRRCP